jgi:hypothetical protein
LEAVILSGGKGSRLPLHRHQKSHESIFVLRQSQDNCRSDFQLPLCHQLESGEPRPERSTPQGASCGTGKM